MRCIEARPIDTNKKLTNILSDIVTKYTCFFEGIVNCYKQNIVIEAHTT